MHYFIYSGVHKHSSYVYKFVFIMQQWGMGQARFLLLSPCRICLFLSASQPPLPPPHSAWGVIKSVYACLQAKEIGMHSCTNAHTVTLRDKLSKWHNISPNIQMYIFNYIQLTNVSTRTSNMFTVLKMPCHQISFFQPVTNSIARTVYTLYLCDNCVCIKTVCKVLRSHIFYRDLCCTWAVWLEVFKAFYLYSAAVNGNVI